MAKSQAQLWSQAAADMFTNYMKFAREPLSDASIARTLEKAFDDAGDDISLLDDEDFASLCAAAKKDLQGLVAEVIFALLGACRASAKQVLAMRERQLAELEAFKKDNASDLKKWHERYAGRPQIAELIADAQRKEEASQARLLQETVSMLMAGIFTIVGVNDETAKELATFLLAEPQS